MLIIDFSHTFRVLIAINSINLIQFLMKKHDQHFKAPYRLGSNIKLLFGESTLPIFMAARR